MKKAALILAGLILFGGLTGCGGETTEETTSVTVNTGNVTVKESGWKIPEGLKFTQADGTPATVHILEREMRGPEGIAEFTTSASETDTISKALYTRNETVCDLLDVDLQVKAEPFNSSSAGKEEWVALIQNLFNAGNNDPWVIADYSYTAPTTAMSGYYYDLNILNPMRENYLSVNAQTDWWNTSFTENATLNDQLYFTVGSANISFIARMEILFYNPILAKDYFPDTNFQELVYNGEWTYEKLTECLKTVGDGDKNDNNSYWGLTARRDTTTIMGMMEAVGIQPFVHSAEGMPLNQFCNANDISWVQSLRELYYENGSVYSDATVGVESPFTSGHAVFHANLMISAFGKKSFEEMPEYSILPMPKGSENQSDYRVCAHPEYSVLSVLNTSSDTDLISATMEALSYYSYQYVRPALFEKTFVQKLQTEKNMTMFYFILDRSFLDFALVYAEPLSSPNSYMCDAIRGSTANIPSDIEARRTPTQTAFEKLIEFFYPD